MLLVVVVILAISAVYYFSSNGTSEDIPEDIFDYIPEDYMEEEGDSGDYCNIPNETGAYEQGWVDVPGLVFWRSSIEEANEGLAKIYATEYGRYDPEYNYEIGTTSDYIDVRVMEFDTVGDARSSFEIRRMSWDKDCTISGANGVCGDRKFGPSSFRWLDENKIKYIAVHFGEAIEEKNPVEGYGTGIEHIGVADPDRGRDLIERFMKYIVDCDIDPRSKYLIKDGLLVYQGFNY